MSPRFDEVAEARLREEFIEAHPVRAVFSLRTSIRRPCVAFREEFPGESILDHTHTTAWVQRWNARLADYAVASRFSYLWALYRWWAWLFERHVIDAPHTVHSYRDTFKLLLGFAACRASKKVADLSLADLDAPTVLAFLEHIEGERKCSIATRNVRLAAIRTFFRIVAANVPTAFEQCQRVIVIPTKLAPRKPVDYLERDELEAVLAAIDRSKRGGLRDYALFALIYNCGNRVQETLELNACDLHLSKPYFVRLLGKGNKERVSPLWPETAAVLRDLFALRGLDPTSSEPVFVNQRGQRLGRDGAAHRLRTHVAKAGVRVSTLGRKRVHPHSLRHTTAVHMRRAGDDPNAIAALLGHSQITTTERFYGHVDLEEKRKAIEANPPPVKAARGRWRRPEVLSFLESL